MDHRLLYVGEPDAVSRLHEANLRGRWIYIIGDEYLSRMNVYIKSNSTKCKILSIHGRLQIPTPGSGG